MRASRSAFTAASWLLAVALGVGCTTTKAEKPQITDQTVAFLGEAYDKLEPGAEGELALRYINRDANWLQYKKLLFEPVQFWAGKDSKIAPDAQQMLATYFYNALKTNLEQQKFPFADLPGPGVIRLQIALMDVTSATPVLRTVSVIVPQARVLNQAQELVTGSYGFAGSAEVVMKAVDSQTGELLAAAIDRRAGGGSLEQATTWQWGDAKAAIDRWTQIAGVRLRELRDRAKMKAAEKAKAK
jgi:hypothetical protein